MYKSVPPGTVCTSPPFDLVTTAELRAAGLSYSAVSKRVKRGALVRRYPGVYSYGTGELSREARAMAAVLACGRDAVLGQLAAADLFDVSRWRIEVPHVLVARRHRPVAGIVIHHCARLDPHDVCTVRGVPSTTVARMLVDLGAVLTAHQLAWVINEAAFRGRFSLEATRRAMARANGHRGIGVLERALELYAMGSAGTKSRYEDAFLALVEPEPLVNMQLCGYEVDFHWPERRLAVEIDGNHTRPRIGGPTRRATACCARRGSGSCASPGRRSSSARRTCSPGWCDGEPRGRWGRAPHTRGGRRRSPARGRATRLCESFPGACQLLGGSDPMLGA